MEVAPRYKLLMEGKRYQIGWIFGKVPKGGGASRAFQSQETQFHVYKNRPFWGFFLRN